MDTEVPCANVLSTNPQKPQRCCCVPSDDNTHTGCINTNNSDYVFDMNDHTTLISNCLLKNKKHHCQCSPLRLKNKSKSQNSKPWVTFMQIFCSVSKPFNSTTYTLFRIRLNFDRVLCM